MGQRAYLRCDPAVGRPQRELVDVDRVSESAELLTEVAQVGLELDDDERRFGCSSRQTKMYDKAEAMERIPAVRRVPRRSLSTVSCKCERELWGCKTRTKIPRPHSLFAGCRRQTVASSKSSW